MKLNSFLASTTIAALLFATPAFAFIDTESFERSLADIESDLSGAESELGSILGALEDVVDEPSTDGHLQFSLGGNLVTFMDVPKSAWFFSYVRTMVELEIVSGKQDSDGKITGYDPAGAISRPAALKMALLAAGVDTSMCGAPTREDAQNHWARDFVACAESMDLGLDDKSLSGTASRAEVLHYLVKAFGIDAPEGNPPFADSKTHEYKNDISLAYALEIVSGDDGANTFRPDEGVNRAEMAKMTELAIQLL